jgi:hypothetical protein
MCGRPLARVLGIGYTRSRIPPGGKAVWWGPFVYGMYLAQVAMGNGDRRLLKRGIRGTALVMLHRDGVLTDAEFAAEKARILDQ